MRITNAVKQIVAGMDLKEEQAFEAMNEIMEGKATDAQIAAFLIALRVKGETVEEITGCVRSLREKANKINPRVEFCVDPVGTGGDGTNTFNISSTAAIVAAAAGATVAKHGNRSVSSRSGSADLYEALGININLSPQAVERCIEDIGFGFMFAPIFHPAMRYASPVRKELGVRTIFNLLGPLSNPAKAHGQVLGVYEKDLMYFVAKTLYRLGEKHALVIHGSDHSDEITISGATYVTELKDDKITDYTLIPEDFGLQSAFLQDIQGGTAQDNAGITLDILKGEKGAKRDVVVLNAAATIYVGQKADSLAEGVAIAQQVIDSGAALAKLEEIRAYTCRQELAAL